MPGDDFPLPEVKEALEPFIKPRQEVRSIQQNLQSYLQNHLNRDGSVLSGTNLTDPQVGDIGPPPEGLSGVRRAYWQALQAHLSAKAKYAMLKAELDELNFGGPAARTSLANPAQESLVQEDYIPLVRQREKQRRLKVIDRALTGVVATGGSVSTSSFDDIAKRQIGDPPAPPGSQPSARVGVNAEVDAKTLDLKKAVIASKRRLDEQKTRNALDKLDDPVNQAPRSEVESLQKVLQELTNWMENQLTIIAESDVENQTTAESSHPKTPNGAGGNQHDSPSSEKIERLYEDYLAARERLVRNVNNPAEMDLSSASDDMETWKIVRGNDEASMNAKPAVETLIPLIPVLSHTTTDEQRLLKQTAFIRRRVATTQTETDKLMRRLADESHLVQPGASDGKDWTEAASKVSNETNDIVQRKVEAGEKSVEQARKALGQIKIDSGELL